LKTVFLTGGTGFVGSHTAERFLADGWRVKALVRDPARPGRLPTGAEPVQGDLLARDQYRPAMRGCDSVVHVAGAVKALDLEGFRAVNSRGVEAVALTAAEACPGARFVLVSSQAAAGPAREGRVVTEADEPRPVSWYGLSKLEGENAVARLFPGPWCVIRPAVVYGPGDPGLLEMFRVVQKGIAPILAGGRRRLQLIAVQDLARMLVAAATRPDLAGRRGFAATDVVSMGDLARKIADLRCPPAKPFPVPAIAIRAAGAFESIRQWLTRRPRPFNRDKAREILQTDWLCDAGPMLRDLLGIVSCQFPVESPIRNGSAWPDQHAGVMPTHSTGSRQAPPMPALTPWKDGLSELCRCYVRDQWLRQNIWAV
jgi:dihydroflavonol-4-reductase